MVTKTLGIKAEWDKLTKVLVHKPGYELHVANDSELHTLLDSDKDNPINMKELAKEFDVLVNTLKHYLGEKNVFFLQDSFFKNSKNKDYMIDLYMESKLNAHTKVDNNHMTGPSFNLKKIYDFAVKKAETSFEEDMWKDVILDMKSALESNYDDIKDSEGRKGAVYEVRPKNNLMFMRDQQFMGDKGYIMCNMKKPARKYPLGKERGEPQVTEIALEQIVGEGPIFKVRGNNTIEGGEYIPCGEFALVGYGSRSNIEAIESVLSAKNEKGERVLGFDKVIAVKTPDAKEVGRGEDMEIMHLDTYFNFAGEGRVVVQPDVAKGTELTEYVLEDGKYVKKGAPKVDGQECKTLWDFIKAKKYKTVELSPLEQRYYGANVLTLDKDNVLVPKIGLHSDKVSTEKYLQKFYDADLKPENVIQLEMKELTKAYGCIHCLTCPIERIPYEQLKKNV